MADSVNSLNARTDQTVKIFDTFYDYAETVPQMEYDAVYSYFLSVFATQEQAANFTVAVFRMAEQSDTSAMALLQQFKGQDLPQLTLTLAYYMNNTRSPTTLLGITAAVTPNFYAAWNVRQ
jgi:N-acetylglucosamine kinase-like BadF-type ATPase